jgi:hypothetical protein
VTVTAPDFTLSGCTFEVNNSIPQGEPTGLKPNFASFTPDASAGVALASIKKNGGKAMVDSAGLPSGTKLYAGPDRSSQVVGTIPSGKSLLLSEPVVWTGSNGETWLATFIECGGPNLYWASLDQIKQVSSGEAATLSSLIKQLAAVQPPYPKSDQASLVRVDVVGHNLAWNTSQITFPVARGQLVDNEP